MSKYIIKNCPASYRGYRSDYECDSKIDDDICLNCNDFESQKTCYECDYEHHREEIYRKRADSSFGVEILSMLEIQECE